MKPFFLQYASVKTSLLLFVIWVLFMAVIMPNLAGDKSAVPIDLQFAYTPDRAYELIDSYSPETRSSYIIGEMTLDVIYPIIYTLFLSLTFLLLYPNKQKIAFFPYVIFIADMLENTGIIIMLYNYPARLNNVAIITSVFSTIKWSLVVIAFVLLITGLIKALLKKK